MNKTTANHTTHPPTPNRSQQRYPTIPNLSNLITVRIFHKPLDMYPRTSIPTPYSPYTPPNPLPPHTSISFQPAPSSSLYPSDPQPYASHPPPTQKPSRPSSSETTSPSQPAPRPPPQYPPQTQYRLRTLQCQTTLSLPSRTNRDKYIEKAG